jgi:hypothetical protein
MKSSGVRRWWVRALLGALALVVLGTELPEIHEHGTSTPGLYSEDCLLARLALPSWGLPAIAPPTVPQPDALPNPGPSPTVVAPSATDRWASSPRLSPTAH